MKLIARMTLIFIFFQFFSPFPSYTTPTPLDTWVHSSKGISGGIIKCLVNDIYEPSVWFAGSAMHGFFKSTDNGNNWASSNQGLQSAAVNTICVSKKNTDYILIGVPQGVYRSTDKGDSWSLSSDEIGHVNDLLELVGSRVSNYFAASNKGLYRSWDNGLTFLPIMDNEVMNKPFNSVIHIPLNPNILYANSIFKGPYISQDGGSSWKNIYKGLPDSKSIGIFAHPNDEKKVYSIYPGEGLYEFIYDERQIKDGDYSWKKISTDLPFTDFNCFAIQKSDYGIAPDKIRCYIVTDKHGMYVSRMLNQFDQWDPISLPEYWKKVNTIGLSYFKKDICMLGLDGRGVIRSENQGTTWEEKNNGLLASWITDFIVDHKDPNQFYLTTYSAAFYSEDKGTSWKSSLKGLPNAELTSVIQSPKNDSHFIVSTKNSANLNSTGDGLYESVDHMKNWRKIATFTYKSVNTLAVSSDNIMYAGSDGSGLYVSRDSGSKWEKIIPEEKIGKMLDRITIIRIDPKNNDIMYVGTTMYGIFKTTDRCKHWEHIYYDKLDRDVYINDIQISTEDSDLIYAGINIITDGGIIRSTNGGKEWEIVNDKRTGTLFTSIYCHPEDRDVIYCGTSNGVLYSKTYGKRWRNLNNGLENIKYNGLYFFSIPKIMLDRERKDILYIATEFGFFRCQVSDLITDKKPPTFNFEFPQTNPFYTNKDLIEFKGKAIDPQGIEIITISGKEIPFEEDGTFDYTLKMNFFKESVVFSTTDKAENTITHQFDLFLDETKPQLVIEAPRPYELLQKKETLIKGYAMDLDSGIEYLDIFGHHYTADKIDENGNFEFLLTNLNTGENQIKIIAYDKAKNSKEASIPVTVEGKDETPPIIELQTPQKERSYQNKSPIMIEGVVKDDMSMDGITFTINGIKYSLISDGSFKIEQPLVEGENPFILKATDLAGNETTKDLLVVLDSIDPEITLPPALNSTMLVYTDQYALQFSTSDQLSGLSTVVLSDQEGNTIQLESTGSQYQATLSLQKGINRFILTAIDNAGNDTIKTLQIQYQPAVVITLTIGNSVATVQKNKDIKPVAMKVPPMIVKGTTFVPIRFIAETFGARVEWIPYPTNEIQIYFKEILIHLWIHKTIGVVERGTETKKVTLLAAPFITNSTTMVPLRFISENLDAQVVWDAPTSTITIIQAVE